MNEYQDTSPSRSLYTVGRRVSPTNFDNIEVLPLHKSVILDSNKKYKPEWQQEYNDTLSFSDISNLNKYRQDKETFDSMLEDVTGVPSFVLERRFGKELFGGGALSTAEEKMYNKMSSYTQDPTNNLTAEGTGDDGTGYDFHPDWVEHFKKNYESAGKDATNVVTLEQFRQMQADGTAQEGIDYLVPKSDKDGNVDFQIFRHNSIKPIE